MESGACSGRCRPDRTEIGGGRLREGPRWRTVGLQPLHAVQRLGSRMKLRSTAWLAQEYDDLMALDSAVRR
jgi:hypothetical protein